MTVFAVMAIWAQTEAGGRVEAVFQMAQKNGKKWDLYMQNGMITMQFFQWNTHVKFWHQHFHIEIS